MFHSGTKSYKWILSALLLEENKMMEEIDDSDTLLRKGKYPFCSYCTGLTKQGTRIILTGRGTTSHMVTWPDMTSTGWKM